MGDAKIKRDITPLISIFVTLPQPLLYNLRRARLASEQSVWKQVTCVQDYRPHLQSIKVHRRLSDRHSFYNKGCIRSFYPIILCTILLISSLSTFSLP
ncbi:hypothetical protein HanRHA438_Chr03g0113201 [Helianthus annuus]|nr:hypothetical protein HanRHA438_Chr03g0113201 [Helianthus annuus]